MTRSVPTMIGVTLLCVLVGLVVVFTTGNATPLVGSLIGGALFIPLCIALDRL